VSAPGLGNIAARRACAYDSGVVAVRPEIRTPRPEIALSDGDRGPGRALGTLARRLLGARLVIMGSIAPIALAVAASTSACLVPPPLQQETATRTYPPVITGGMPDFMKQPYVVPPPDYSVTFSVTVRDEEYAVSDTTPTLTAAIFYLRSGVPQLQPTGLAGPLTGATADNPVATITFPSVKLCQFYGLPEGLTQVFVYVADTEIGIDPTALKSGHYESRSWLVQCPAAAPPTP
jgi:hypothetical protein